MSRKYPTSIEVWGHGAPGSSPRVRLGTASTIRGVRQVVKRHPGIKRVVLRGTADALDLANGRGYTWWHALDMVTHDVPIEYEIIKESA